MKYSNKIKVDFYLLFFLLLIQNHANCQLFDFLSKESDKPKMKGKSLEDTLRFEEINPKTQFIDTLLSQAHSMISSRNKDLEEKKLQSLNESLKKGKNLQAKYITSQSVRVPSIKITNSLSIKTNVKVKIGELELSIPELQMIILMGTRLLKNCGKNLENCIIRDNDLDELTMNNKEREEERETLRYLKKSAIKDLNEYTSLDEELSDTLYPHKKNLNSEVTIADFDDSLNF